MSQRDTAIAARRLLETCTPMKGDCGKRCGAACCQADETGQNGMILFPGEESLYDPCPPWAAVHPLPDGSLQGKPLLLLTCMGHCDRENRPLACRIFPLTPLVAGDGADVGLDTRAWPICPLMEGGMRGLSGDFVKAARAAALLLYEDEHIRPYLQWLTAHLGAFANLL